MQNQNIKRKNLLKENLKILKERLKKQKKE